MDAIVRVLYQEPERDPEWFYKRVLCPLFRRVAKTNGEPLIQDQVGSGHWETVPVKAGKHLCHTDPKKELLRDAEGSRRICVLIDGLLGVQAGAPTTGRKATILSQIVTPGELVRHFGLAAQLGKSPYRKDELAAVYALTDSWVLTIPESDFLGRGGQHVEDRGLYVNMAIGLMGSLFDALSTNRMIERRLAGAHNRVRFVATMLAVVARHGIVDTSAENPEDWSVTTRFKAPSQFYKGLARLREGDTQWRGKYHLDGVLEIPRRSGRVTLWPKKLALPEAWSKFEAQIDRLRSLSGTDQRAKGFREICRDLGYSAYRLPDRPDAERLSALGFGDDCNVEWERFLLTVLPKEKKDPMEDHWLSGS